MKFINWKIISSLLLLCFNCMASDLESGIRFFNQMQYVKAASSIEDLVNKNDEKALFWLGVIQFRTGKQFDAGSSFLKSAKLGNPWAMNMLVPKRNGYCEYLGWECDDSWAGRAMDRWNKLAQEGDGKAHYAAIRWKDKPWWSFSFLDDTNYDQLVENIVFSGGYEAASYSGFSIDLSKRVELLKFEAKRNYAPAMIALYRMHKSGEFSIKNSEKYLNDALNLGYSGGAVELFYKYYPVYHNINKESDFDNLSEDDYDSLRKLYYYSLVSKGLGYEINFGPEVLVRTKSEENKIITLLPSSVQDEIHKKAEDFISKVKPNLFLDESSDINELLNP